MAKKAKILLADDEEDIKTVISLYLGSKGYEVVTAYDGLDAIDKAKSEKPDLILLDVMMPIMNGFEVCQKLKDDPDTQDIPIIMLSAAAQSETITKSIELGAKDYIVKPFEPERLDKMIFKYLNK